KQRGFKGVKTPLENLRSKKTEKQRAAGLPGQTPVQRFACLERDDGLAVGVGQAGGQGPLLAHQRDGFGVAGQAVEVWPEVAGEAFQLVERVCLFEGGGVKLQ